MSTSNDIRRKKTMPTLRTDPPEVEQLPPALRIEFRLAYDVEWERSRDDAAASRVAWSSIATLLGLPGDTAKERIITVARAGDVRLPDEPGNGKIAKALGLPASASASELVSAFQRLVAKDGTENVGSERERFASGRASTAANATETEDPAHRMAAEAIELALAEKIPLAHATSRVAAAQPQLAEAYVERYTPAFQRPRPPARKWDVPLSESRDAREQLRQLAEQRSTERTISFKDALAQLAVEQPELIARVAAR